MQDMNRDKFFNKNENLSLNEKQNRVDAVKIGSAFSELDKSRKIAVVFLAFFSVILFFTWGITTKNRINKPLRSKVSTEIFTEAGQKQETTNKDSDGDGLTDWDEENLYNTSPYLEDTDSDGILDNVEVNNGTDPNCKEGGNCSVDILEEESEKTKENGINNSIDMVMDLNLVTGTTSKVVNENDLSNALRGESDVETLRRMLLEAGMEKSIMASISDEDLLNSYKEILQ